jgi:hypothetical protein
MINPDLYTNFRNLEEATKKAGRLAILDIDPLSETEALETSLRLITVNGPVALFWSEELSRPAFFISEGECDDDECTTQIRVNQFSGDIFVALKYQPSTFRFLLNLTKSEKLQQYVSLLAEAKNAEEAYRKARREIEDRKEYDRLRQKFETPTN